MVNGMRRIYATTAVLMMASALALTGCSDKDKDDASEKLKKKIESAQGATEAEEDDISKYYEIDQRGYIMGYSGSGGEVILLPARDSFVTRA